MLRNAKKKKKKMLQCQYTTAIVAARQKIVEGAVGMAQMAIEQLLRMGR